MQWPNRSHLIQDILIGIRDNRSASIRDYDCRDRVSSKRIADSGDGVNSHPTISNSGDRRDGGIESRNACQYVHHVHRVKQGKAIWGRGLLLLSDSKNKHKRKGERNIDKSQGASLPCLSLESMSCWPCRRFLQFSRNPKSLAWSKSVHGWMPVAILSGCSAASRSKYLIHKKLPVTPPVAPPTGRAAPPAALAGNWR
jgi:hypothetical protein